jgi:hypothetical protein
MSDRDEHALVAEISDRVDELAIAHDPKALAPLLEQRARDLAPDAPGRAAWLSHAGEYWEIAEEPERALSCYDEALAHGGPTWIDVRASLVGVLLGLGDEPRADALLDELRQDLAKGPLHGPVQEYVGEKLEAHDRPEDAQQWFSAGVLSGTVTRRPSRETSTGGSGCGARSGCRWTTTTSCHWSVAVGSRPLSIPGRVSKTTSPSPRHVASRLSG